MMGKREDQNGYSEEDINKKKKGVVMVGGSSCGGAGKKGSGSSSSNIMRSCQAEKCNANLNDAKQYHRRHRVCEYHAKAQIVLVAGTPQRFCQQCSRFGEVRLFLILLLLFSNLVCPDFVFYFSSSSDSLGSFLGFLGLAKFWSFFVIKGTILKLGE